ncbi:hypothetical protein ACHAW6_013671 [Cyclotella cf. meneghiniana]
MSANNNHHDAIYDMSLSNKTILILCTVGFASLGMAIYFLLLRHVPSADDAERHVQNYDRFLATTDAAALNRAERRARAKLRMKKARLAAVPAGRGDDDDGAPRRHGPNEDDDERFGLIRENAGAHLTRKERQKAAKALEKEERKMAAELARVRREADGKTNTKKQTDYGEPDCETDNRRPPKPRLEDIFPPREQSDDPMSDYLFWQSISANYKDDPQRFLEDAVQSRIMTIRDFIAKLEKHRSVSIAALADEFGITITNVRNDLEKLNAQYGIIGLMDNNGNFVYVSREMIAKAVQMGKDMGRVSSCLDESVVAVSQ